VLLEIGAGDLSGAGAALASVTQVGPVVTAIVVAGAGSTAMCADLGARTIREEIDAMKVIGVNPIQALVVPRVIAATFVALMLYSVVAIVGLTGSYVFVVYVQHVTPGAFVAGLTLLTGLPQVIVSLVKALLFGLSAGLIACYKGLSVGGGPTGVGNAVNETVVFAFMALFFINILATAMGVKIAPTQ
jgi:phospholipid/cholesterol/gamma-HCH transport system permease protein